MLALRYSRLVEILYWSFHSPTFSEGFAALFFCSFFKYKCLRCVYRHKAYIKNQHPKFKGPLERHLFHGTTEQASEDICHNNFDPRLAGVNGASHGYGSYFAIKASTAYDYSAKVGHEDVRYMFLAKVLVGKTVRGKHFYRRPPPINLRLRQHHLYDSCVDSVNNPNIYVVFDSCQCYPYYLIKCKDIPEEVELS